MNGRPKPAYRALVVLHRELGGPGWRFVADRSRALRLPRGIRGVGEGFALEFAGPGARRVLALWYANERPPSSGSPFASVEPVTAPRTIVVRTRVGSAAAVVDMLGHRRSAPLDRTGSIAVRVGQDPTYVTWRAAPSRFIP